MAYIAIKDMLATMASGKTFQLKVVTYDKKRKKGGEIVDYAEAVQVIKREEAEADSQRPMTRIEQMKHDLSENEVDTSRNPSHGEHYTRNINVLQEGIPTAIVRKIHPLLVIEFNHKKVVP